MRALAITAVALLAAGCAAPAREEAVSVRPATSAPAPTGISQDQAVARLREARSMAARGQTVRAREMVQTVIPDAERWGWQEVAADAHFMVGEMRDRERSARDAADAYARSFDASRRLADAARGVRALNALANALLDAGALDKSMEASREAQKLAARDGILGGQATALNNLGEAHRLAGRLADARVEYDRALRLVREAGDRRAEMAILLNLGSVERRLVRQDDARRHFATAREIGLALKDTQAVTYAQWNLDQIDADLKGRPPR